MDGNDGAGLTPDDRPVDGRRRVLVVDDNDATRRVAERQLGRRDLDVVTADGGRAALELLAAQPFDLVFLDGMMPGMDGAATAREIRRRERHCGTPGIAIVALTASALPEDRERMLEAGMDDLLAKPVRLEELAAALAHWLPDADRRRTAVIPPVATGGGLIDDVAVDRLRELGDGPFVARIVRLFLADAAERVAQVERAVAMGDATGCALALAALESISAIVGAGAVGRRARELRAEAIRSFGAIDDAATRGLVALLEATSAALAERLPDLGES